MAKNRLYDEDVLVIGLGRFGAAAALELQRLGHTVVAVEKDSLLAEAFSRKLSRVIHADAASPDIVDLARHAQLPASPSWASAPRWRPPSSPPATSSTPGVPSIWAKAVSPEHARILAAHRRRSTSSHPRPTRAGGWRTWSTARCWTTSSSRTATRSSRWPRRARCVGFTLGQSQIRSKYGVTVVGVKAPGEDFSYAVPETRVTAAHTLIVSGPTELIERLASGPDAA